MLFNSYQFLLVFLPISLFGYFLAAKTTPSVSILWLVLCSLAFYANWNPPFVLLILASIAFNFAMGEIIAVNSPDRTRTAVFRVAVAANLLCLGGFKYFAPTLNFINPGAHLSIILPLGISFFTFTQIGFLVDRRDNVGERLNLSRYSLFVTFFPHLIAGPILHVREMGPQLKATATYKLRAETFAPGLTMFVIGLAKKVLVADPLADMVSTGYLQPELMSFVSAWMVIIAYSIQLYFDFSGYSDMAIGLAGMFGFRFPLNFNSPFKSRSIIEFWQRWHVTLSRYLALLLYNPMAMWIARRRAASEKKISPKALANPAAFASMIAVPTFYTMGLAGIWHGAGLQYAVFGMLHAIYLTINHAWRIYRKARIGHSAPEQDGIFSQAWKVALTYLAVLLSFVFFRAGSIPNALALLASASGIHGFGFPPPVADIIQQKLGIAVTAFMVHKQQAYDFLRIVICLIVIWAAPNSQQLMGAFAPVLDDVPPGPWRWLRWRPTLPWAFAVSLVLWLSILCFNQTKTFLYYQF